MKNKKKLLAAARKAITESFNNHGSIDESRINQIIDKFRKLPSEEAIVILQAYAKGLKAEIKRLTLTIETATELSKEQTKEIAAAFRADYQILKIETILNPKLIGGLKIRIGDSIFDDSVVSRIEKLKEEIKS